LRIYGVTDTQKAKILLFGKGKLLERVGRKTTGLHFIYLKKAAGLPKSDILQNLFFPDRFFYFRRML